MFYNALTIKSQFFTTYKGFNSIGLQTYKAALIKTTEGINSSRDDRGIQLSFLISLPVIYTLLETQRNIYSGNE